MAPRGPTAYFLFAEEQRDAVKTEIEARDGKAGVAVVGKEIGARWQQLSDEEKQAYKDRAAQRAAELKEQLANQAASAEESGGAGSPDGGAVEAAAAAHEAAGGSSAQLPFGLPTSLVKKVMTMDPEVQRVSADGVRCIAKAAELFIQMLAAKAFREAAQHKRKNLRFGDIEAVARLDRRLQEMGLKEFLANDEVFAEVHERAEGENQSKRGNKKQAVEEPKGMKPMTAYFGGAA